MNTATSNLEPLEGRGLAGSFLPPISADSGCWHHVQWPRGPGVTSGGSRFRGIIFSVGSVRKLAKSGFRAELSGGKLRPGAAR